MRGETSAPVSSTGGAADQEEKWSQFVLNLYTKKKNFDQKQKIHFVSQSLEGKRLLWLLSNEKCKSLS